MSDAAYQNAKARRDALAAEKNALLQRVEDADRALARVDQFLKDWEVFASGSEHIETIVSKPVAFKIAVNPSARPKNPPKEEVGRLVYDYLDQKGEPASRRQIFAHLQACNVNLEGTDPQMVLSTMLWRLKSNFYRIPGRGYWIVGRPVPEPRENDT